MKYIASSKHYPNAGGTNIKHVALAGRPDWRRIEAETLRPGGLALAHCGSRWVMTDYNGGRRQRPRTEASAVLEADTAFVYSI
jgi:hypothetical protein